MRAAKSRRVRFCAKYMRVRVRIRARARARTGRAASDEDATVRNDAIEDARVQANVAEPGLQAILAAGHARRMMDVICSH